MPESQEYGISSFTLESDRPFHPVKLFNLLSLGKLKNVIIITKISI